MLLLQLLCYWRYWHVAVLVTLPRRSYCPSKNQQCSWCKVSQNLSSGVVVLLILASYWPAIVVVQKEGTFGVFTPSINLYCTHQSQPECPCCWCCICPPVALQGHVECRTFENMLLLFFIELHVWAFNDSQKLWFRFYYLVSLIASHIPKGT